MTAGHDAPWSVTPEAAVAAVRDVVFGHGKLEVVPKVHVGSARDIATLYERRRRRQRKPRRKAVLDVRPQDLGHAPSPEPTTLSGTVSLVELLGSEKLVEVELADKKRICVQVRSDTPVDIGDQFNVLFDPQRVHVFDASTGDAIR